MLAGGGGNGSLRLSDRGGGGEGDEPAPAARGFFVALAPRSAGIRSQNRPVTRVARVKSGGARRDCVRVLTERQEEDGGELHCVSVCCVCGLRLRERNREGVSEGEEKFRGHVVLARNARTLGTGKRARCI